MAPVLGYYDLRGLADPIRFLLHHAGVEFEDKHYPVGPPPDYSKSVWFAEKFNLGLHFPNLPYYIDGDVKITQTVAILRYLGRKHDLIAKTDEELLLSDQVEQVIMETLAECSRAWYPKENYEPMVKMLEENLPKKIEQFSKFLGDHKFLIGDRVTYVDFLMYSCLDRVRIYNPAFLEPAANLKAYLDRIEALPKVSAYLTSGKFHRKPINGAMARWGGSRD